MQCGLAVSNSVGGFGDRLPQHEMPPQANAQVWEHPHPWWFLEPCTCPWGTHCCPKEQAPQSHHHRWLPNGPHCTGPLCLSHPWWFHEPVWIELSLLPPCLVIVEGPILLMLPGFYRWPTEKNVGIIVERRI